MDAPPFVARPPSVTLDEARAPLVRPVAHAAELGPFAPLVADPRVTDVLANGGAGVWVDRGSGLEPVPGLALDEPALRELAVRLVARAGRHVDEASPCVDARLGPGLRVHVVLPPVSPRGTLLSLRIARARPFTLEELDEGPFFAHLSRQAVLELVRTRANILISGAAGTGKTTLLSAILAAVPPDERIVAIEDVAELRVRHPHLVTLEARQPNLEGAGGIGLARLVREALRMRPDRLVLGECRGSEIRELLAALNTGHDGGAGTLHASSLDDIPARLEALGALAGFDPIALARQAVSAFDAIIHLDRVGGARRIAAAGTLGLTAGDRLTVQARP